MQTAILDFFDFHACVYGESDISTQNASIMDRFLKMLENGTYREHREVTYYADCLCVTSKYLSEVSKKVHFSFRGKYRSFFGKQVYGAYARGKLFPGNLELRNSFEYGQ